MSRFSRSLFFVLHLSFFILFAATAGAQKAKYVFFFIGDGMGLNQVGGTEMYLAELEGRIGTKHLLFTQFPVVSMATTYSITNAITDSSAGGTALSTGSKTYNGGIGVDVEGQALTSVAERAKASGRRVGITTSVSVDHATPAAFYAHQPQRKMYYEIALDLPRAGFDFYAGSGFLKPHTSYSGDEMPDAVGLIEKAGYTVVRGVDEYKAKSGTADRMVLIQEEGADPESLPYAIDRKEGDLTLSQITTSAIDFLTKDSDKGFFLMVEGGKIDWACHGNDPATCFREVIDLNEAVEVAYEFYKQHPEETLIVVSADHETGGLGLGAGTYVLNLQALQHQKLSQEELTLAVGRLREEADSPVTWDDVRTLLSEKMGFWTELTPTWEQERALRDEYQSSFVEGKTSFEETMYAKNDALSATAVRVMSSIARVGWTTPDHSAGYVPIYAIGAGQDLFIGLMDNIDIPDRIAKAAGYE